MVDTKTALLILATWIVADQTQIHTQALFWLVDTKTALLILARWIVADQTQIYTQALF